jgi:predicted nucleic acid-binding protein
VILVDTSVWIDELACGGLRNRSDILHALANLPRSARAGYVDAHLLAAVSIASPAHLWTRDRRLQSLADLLGVGSGLPV